MVANGLFTVTLDFGPSVFTGDARWLEIGVRTNGSAEDFVTLTPRQALTPIPHALYALNAGAAASLAGTLPDAQLSANIARLNSNLTFTGAVQFSNSSNQLTGSFNGDGWGLRNLDLAAVNSWGAMQVNHFFTLVSSPSVGSAPTSVVAGDLNGDGWPDLAAGRDVDYILSTVTVLTNNRSGGFAAAGWLGGGPNVIALVGADVNGDALLDLVSVSQSSSTLRVLTNNGTGWSGLASSLTVGSVPTAVAIGDVNGDGRPDLISANGSGTSLSVLTNSHPIPDRFEFRESDSRPAIGTPTALVATDVNEDGRIDLICAGQDTDKLSVWTNRGGATFGLVSAPSPSSVHRSASLAVADVNGDGWVECVTAGGSELTVLTNDGRGGFGVKSFWDAGRDLVAVLAGDVNGDGCSDLVTLDVGDGLLRILFNASNGSFTTASSVSVEEGTGAKVASDFNGDGHLDLITGSERFHRISLFRNDGLGHFSLSATVAAPDNDFLLAPDLNRDGVVDLVSGSTWGDRLSVLLGHLQVTFSGTFVGEALA